MRILIAGGTGFVGSAIKEELKEHDITLLTRKKDSISIFWDPKKEMISPSDLEGFDVVINLAGETIMGKWNAKKKKHIYESRVLTTQFLVKTLNNLKRPPKLLVNASAIGYYGNGSDSLFKEDDPCGNTFLSGVCRSWESVADQFKGRCVKMRLGMVLDNNGGALAKMLTPFRLGLGGRLGKGDQWMSWITLHDVVRATRFFIENEKCSGAYNLVSPHPVTNKQFTKVLSRILKRPAFFHIPTWILKLILGDLAKEVLLSSTRASSAKLEKAGFKFTDPELGKALEKMLKGK